MDEIGRKSIGSEGVFNEGQSDPFLSAVAGNALASRTISTTCDKSVHDVPKKAVLLDQMPLKEFFIMRPLNIAGSSAKSSNPKLQLLHRKALEFAEEYGFGDERYESDIAVAVPNSRIDMLYSQDLNFDYQKGKVLPRQAFKMTNYLDHGIVPFKLTEVIHASPDAENVYDMVYIPSICKQNFSACEHPTYGLILKHLANCQDISMGCNKERLDDLLQVSFRS